MVSWTTKSYPFSAGISNKHEEKAIPIGKLEVLENGQFDEFGSIGKRNGFDAVASGIATDMQAFNMVDTYQLLPNNNTLYACATRAYSAGNIDTPEGEYVGPKLLSYSSDTSEWSDCGSFVGTEIEIDKLGPDMLNVDYSNIAQTDDYFVHMVHNTSDSSMVDTGGFYSVIEKDSGKRIVDWTQYTNAAVSPFQTQHKIMGFSDRVWMMNSRSSTTTIYYNPWQASLIHTTPLQFPVITDLNADEAWDAVVVDDEIHIVYIQVTTNKIVYNVYSPGKVLQSTFTSTDTAQDFVSISIAGSTGQTCVVYGKGTTTEMSAFMSNGTSELLGPWVIWDRTTNVINNATVTGTTWLSFWFDYTDASSDQYLYLIEASPTTGTLRANTGLSVVSETSLISKAFTVTSDSGDEIRLAWTGTSSSEQAGYYLMGTSKEWSDSVTPAGLTRQYKPIVYTKCFYQSGTGSREKNSLSNVIEESDGFSTSLLSTSTLLSDGFVREYANKVKAKFYKKNASIELIDGTLISGGSLQSIRGGVIAEEGLLEYPEDLTIASLTSGGLLAAGTYGVIAIYEWRDNSGILHRSAPSTSVSVTTTTSNSSISVTSDKHRDKYTSNAVLVFPQLVIYRTEVNGSIYYRDKETFTTATLTQLDSTLTNNEFLYTTGGVLGNFSPPPSSYIWANKDRVFLLASDEDAIWYSKTKLTGTSWGFNPIQKIVLSKKPVAGADQDGRQIIFFEDSIAFFTGEGPNNLGVGVFTKLENIPTTIGCIDKHSVLNIDNGIMFKSKSDFYLLDRSLQVVPIGLDVSDYNSETVLAAVTKDRKAYFAMSGGDVLVYDWLVNQWSVSKIILDSGDTSSLVDICELNDRLYTLGIDSSGLPFIQKESTTSFVDSSNAISLKVTTGWIPLTNNKSGWVRVRRLSLLGEKKSDHTLTVKIYQDYNDTTPTQTETIDASLITDEPYLLRIRLDNQKCSAIKVEVSDAGTGENYSLTEMVLEIGLKHGTNRTDNSNTF